jgi:hypothetical protein
MPVNEKRRQIYSTSSTFAARLRIFMPMEFKLTSAYRPTGDQPEAIRQLVTGVQAQEH